MTNVKAYIEAFKNHRYLSKVYQKHGMPNLARYNRAQARYYIKLIRSTLS